jgi:hypothetical protein
VTAPSRRAPQRRFVASKISSYEEGFRSGRKIDVAPDDLKRRWQSSRSVSGFFKGGAWSIAFAVVRRIDRASRFFSCFARAAAVKVALAVNEIGIARFAAFLIITAAATVRRWSPG